MAPRVNPVRLLIEALVIIGLAQGLVAWAHPHIAPDWEGAAGAVLQGLALALLAGPALYWRFLAHKHRAERAHASATPGARKTSRASVRWAIALTAGAQVVTLLLTAAATVWTSRSIEHRVHERFNSHAERLEAEVLRRFTLPLYGLRGLASTYAANQQIKRAEFLAYMEGRNVDLEFPGVRGMGYIERVPRGELEAFIARERADDAPDFSVKTKGEAPELYVIKFIEPYDRNRAARGLDVGAEAVRREGVERATTTGQPALTARITLVQDGKKGPGFLLLLPIYRVGADPATPAQRLRALRGLVYAPIAMSELMSGVVDAADGLLDFEVFEGTEQSRSTLLYDADEHLSTSPGTLNEAQHYHDRRHSRTHSISVGGRTMLLRITSNARFDASVDRTQALIAAVGGVLLSFLMALAVWLLAVGQVRAQTLARRMTADLDRLATVVRHTSNRVAITDTAHCITWANPSYEAHASQPLAELVGQPLIELRPSAELPLNASQRALHEALGRPEPYRGEINYSDAQGRTHWLRVDLQPVHDEQGRLTGQMLIEADISELIDAKANLEAALRDNDAILQALHTHNIVSVADRDGKIVDVNAAFCRVSGYTRTELIGADHRIVNSGQHSREFWSEFWHTISQGEPWRGEICNRAKDGHLYWVDTMLAPLIGEDGFVEKYISIRTDITHIKAAQLALEETTQRLRLAIEGGSDGLWDWFDVYGNAEWWSPQFYRLLGYEPGEIEASRVTFDEMVHPADRERTFAATEAALSQKATFDVEYRLRTKGGSYRWFRARAKVYFNDVGDPQRMAGSIQDIHARKEADAALTETTTLLTGVLASATEMSVIAIDPQRIIRVFNRGAERLLGYSAAEMVGQQTPVIIHDPQEIQDRAAAMSETLGRAIVGPEVLTDASVHGQAREWTSIRKDGSRVPVSLIVTAILDPQGETQGYLGIAQDISERKQYETSLQEARARAEAASVAKSQFLANMSHEIRTPMNAILGMLRLLQSTPLTSRQLDYTSKTEGAARSLLTLLNDILDFSKVEAGKMVIERQPFRIDRLLRDLSVILSANVGRKNLDVLFEIDPELPRVLVGDSMRLQQVLINLGGNAIKFTQHGEVHIRLRRMAAPDGSPRVEFQVRDTGIGIAPENQQHIFAGFTQAEASTTRRFGGTGLGLVISQRLVALMGGELQLESALGVGTTFRFHLDLPEGAAPGENPREHLHNAPQRVLIVDDNPLARTVLSAMCHSLGWQADAVASGAEALNRIAPRGHEATPYDTLFVDWQMPGMDGWETTVRLREAGPRAQSPLIIMVTANSIDTLNQRSEQEQALLDGFLIKPLTPSMLLDAVLDGRAHRDSPNQLRLTHHHAAHRLQGLRILVVEDNLNNQQVAQELLSEEGATITLASNGQEGVNAVAQASAPFDAVLMDVQMPVMDGYTACHHIRTRLQMTELPIIAMTANAMSSDRDACLAAGMNDHVGKPFDLDRLVAVLQQHTQGRTPARTAASDAVPNTPAGAAQRRVSGEALAFAQSQGIDLPAALHRMGNNLGTYLRVLRSIDKDLPLQADALAALRDRSQQGDAARLLHTLKGMAGTVGLTALATRSAECETQLHAALQTPNTDYAATIAALAAQLRPACDAAQSGISQLLARLSADNGAGVHDAHNAPSADKARQTPASLDATALQRDLQALSELLRHADMQALDVHQQLLTHHGAALGAQLKALDDAMGRLDFPQALAHCAQLREQFSAPASHSAGNAKEGSA